MKFILSTQEQRQGPRVKVSSEGLSAEIDILQWSPIQVQTKVDVDLPQHTRRLTVIVCCGKSTSTLVCTWMGDHCSINQG